jgi:hypothetical protein
VKQESFTWNLDALLQVRKKYNVIALIGVKTGKTGKTGKENDAKLSLRLTILA